LLERASFASRAVDTGHSAEKLSDGVRRVFIAFPPPDRAHGRIIKNNFLHLMNGPRSANPDGTALS